MIALHPIPLRSCLKTYTTDLDKTQSPEQTIAMVKEALLQINADIVAATRRVDTGRLNIPVFMSICGADARTLLPTRKQMGKGSSVAQAEASALMELMERYAFFSFWQNRPQIIEASWSKAKELFGDALIPVSEILRSVNDTLDGATAEQILDCATWQFYPATHLASGKIIWLPLDWFRMLGEFNGSSAGNSNEESILQGISELIERHVCAIISNEKIVTPTINLYTCADPVLKNLVAAFANNKINLVLKDFSLGLPLPTVAAIAWDDSTFPEKSEIVFTAGTASSPAKAAIRAITEVAQLGGDFCTNSCYEASGLPKFNSLEDCQWLLQGSETTLHNLPSVKNQDIAEEIKAVLNGLAPIQIYCVDITNEELNIPAHYCIAPGLQFRERDRNQSLGLFVGRKIAEEEPYAKALPALAILAKAYPKAHFIPFFYGLIELKNGDADKAASLFISAADIQPDAEATAMCLFYAGYSLCQSEQWAQALPYLQKAAQLSPQMKEYVNFLGVANYKLGRYADAEAAFDQALAIDKGSAIDLANRGLCRKALGKISEAREDLQTALELDPSIEFAQKALAELQ